LNSPIKTVHRIPGLVGLLFIVSAASAAGILPPARTENPAAPADFPGAYYHQQEALGNKILRIDSLHSLVIIEVHRAGVLSRLGHDHVVASRNVNGYASMSAGVADLYVPLDKLVVDEPGLRTAAGFNTQPSQQDIEGTRRNMLTRTLDTGHFPYALIHVARADADRQNLQVTIALHGMMRSYEVPAQFETVPGGIAVAGRMSFKQSNFGITPLSVLGGALRVQDQLDLRFHILAQGN
jgi:hypothetical protein